MNKERIVEIGKFLETRLFIHRQIEKNDRWSTEEKMIKDLYDEHLSIKQENTNLKQALNEIREYCNKIKNFYWVENDEPIYVNEDLLQIIDKGLGEDKE